MKNVKICLKKKSFVVDSHYTSLFYRVQIDESIVIVIFLLLNYISNNTSLKIISCNYYTYY